MRDLVRELAIEHQRTRDRVERELSHVWHLAALERTAKLPAFGEFVHPRPVAPQSKLPTQTPEQQRMILQSLAAQRGWKMERRTFNLTILPAPADA